METYDKRLEAKKKTIAAADTSSIMVSFAIFDNLMKLSITKHNPNKFEDVGKI
jgi:hypothetical protein